LVIFTGKMVSMENFEGVYDRHVTLTGVVLVIFIGKMVKTWKTPKGVYDWHGRFEKSVELVIFTRKMVSMEIFEGAYD